MDAIISLVREYRNAPDTNEKIKVAQKIILSISADITVFLLAHAAADTDDLRQEIFVAIIRGLDGFRGDSHGEFWAWCYRIARNIVAKHFKRQDKNQTLSVEPEKLERLVEASAQKEAMTGEEQTIIDEALTLLRNAMPECFELLWKRYILELGIKEIASELDVAFDAARMKINRCLDSARSLLEEP